MRRVVVLLVTTLVASLAACGPGLGSGSAWVNQPLTDDEGSSAPRGGNPTPAGERAPSRTIGNRPRNPDEVPKPSDPTGGGGKVLGTFRNTYYDFPREGDHTGEPVALMNASCQPIAQVPRGFYEAVCVQGSGSLRKGGTVSFAKRDCACAEVCPRTGQKICFDALDAKTFPFGRGATGKPIVPMRSVAADTSVLPMGTVIYVPDFDGAPKSDHGETMDGCFVVEDRGSKVVGEHVDIFTGAKWRTKLLEERVPSNQGVTVVVDAPRCAHLGSPATKR